MAKLKVGITLSAQTLERLEFLCEINGLTKSQAIALAINTFVNEKHSEFYRREGERSGRK